MCEIFPRPLRPRDPARPSTTRHHATPAGGAPCCLLAVPPAMLRASPNVPSRMGLTPCRAGLAKNASGAAPRTPSANSVAIERIPPAIATQETRVHVGVAIPTPGGGARGSAHPPNPIHRRSPSSGMPLASDQKSKRPSLGRDAPERPVHGTKRARVVPSQDDHPLQELVATESAGIRPGPQDYRSGGRTEFQREPAAGNQGEWCSHIPSVRVHPNRLPAAC